MPAEHYSDTKQIRVLAIEDNADFAQLLGELLMERGCAVDLASDALSGLALARSLAPDLIFCDIGLPGAIDGLEFARQLRSEAELADIFLVAITGYASARDKRAAIEAGFDLVFAKPVRFADLGTALDAFSLRRREEAR